jgi:catechol 2,3-dioxygenase-like lactoylglutathione lyase family enzyme
MQIVAVESIGMTVGDMERSLNFYTAVLGFKKISESEITGAECDRLYGLSNVRLRLAKLQLGNEYLN